MTHRTLTIDAPLTTGQVARACGCERWQVLAAIRRGFLEEPPRVGPFRVWQAADVKRVRAALAAGGYLAADKTE